MNSRKTFSFLSFLLRQQWRFFTTANMDIAGTTALIDYCQYYLHTFERFLSILITLSISPTISFQHYQKTYFCSKMVSTTCLHSMLQFLYCRIFPRDTSWLRKKLIIRVRNFILGNAWIRLNSICSVNCKKKNLL